MIKLKDILEFRSGKPSSGKPEKGDYVRDGKFLFGKILKVERGKVITNNMSGKWPKHVVEISFDIKKLKMSEKKGQIERNVGRPIWVPK